MFQRAGDAGWNQSWRRTAMKTRILNRHSLVMVLCCLGPLAALGVALLLGASLSSALVLGLVLLCPLAHVLMMGTMHQKDHEHGEHQQREVSR
jgi:hypothetical protein